MSDFEDQIWSYLKHQINNDYGVAGLMGNLKAESGCIPYRLQGDFASGHQASKIYTEKVDNGVITKNEFVTDGKGYGLAQWTFSTRKRNLYDFASLSVNSIGSLDRQLPFLVKELRESYPTVWIALLNATSIRSASDVVLVQFENPADQSEAVKVARAELGQNFYNIYHGIEPDPPGPEPGPGPTPPSSPPPKWLLIKMVQNQQI